MNSRWAGFLCVLMLLVPCAPRADASAAVPDFATVRAHHRTTEGRLVDRAGVPLAERRVGFEGRRLEWVSLDALSPAMKEALLEAEDRRFYEHGGIDWRAFAAAAIQNLWYEHPRGASTLTMQLVGLLDPALHPGNGHGGRRTLEQKWDQAVAAQQIEAQWSKADILEAYLNLAPFRGELLGIHAAARALVGKAPDTLDRAEASVLAALLRAPNAAPQKVAWRACELVARIGSPELCDRARALADRLDPVRLEPRWNDAPHLARRLVTAPGSVVHTVLDAHWQRRMIRALEDAAPARAAVIVLDNATGAVLADVGGLSPAHPDATTQRFAAGAMMWPVSCALALDTTEVTAATLFDMPAQAAPVSLRGALVVGPLPLALRAHVPAAKEALMIEVLRAGGAGAPALSQLRIALPQLAALGRMMAVDGQWRAPYWLPTSASVPVPVISPMAAFVASDLFARVRSAEVVAGRSAWAVGSNAEITLAVWMETGASAPLEARTWVAGQLAEMGAWPPERVVPSGVVQRRVRFDAGLEPARDEWFLKGTATAVAMPPSLSASIVTPAQRAIVGVDDLDADRGLWLSASKDDARLHWQVDGVPAGTGGRVRWAPMPGLHRVELLDSVGRQVDAVDFAVRSDVADPSVDGPAGLDQAEYQPGQ